MTIYRNQWNQTQDLTIFLHRHRSIEGFPAPLARMLRRLRGLGSAALYILQTPSQLNKA